MTWLARTNGTNSRCRLTVSAIYFSPEKERQAGTLLVSTYITLTNGRGGDGSGVSRNSLYHTTGEWIDTIRPLPSGTAGLKEGSFA